MNLGFMTEWPANMHGYAGSPTLFPEKIIASLDLPDYKKYTLNDGLAEVMMPSDYWFDKGMTNPMFPHIPKIHSIREDKGNRWSEEKDIHFIINNQRPNRYQFAPVTKCTGVQRIEVSRSFDVIVDGRKLTNQEVYVLAKNDGFENVSHFRDYFKGYFIGNIVHWSDLRY